jgi:hypothetical protein
MSRYLSDNVTYDNSGKYSSRIPLILSPLLADCGLAGYRPKADIQFLPERLFNFRFYQM